MPIRGDKVAEMPRDVLVKRRHAPCIKCKTQLRESMTGCRPIKGGPICSDCYFVVISDHIDHNPLDMPVDIA
jgi:hypothetical protein